MGGEKFARGFFCVPASDAGDENGSGWRRRHRARRHFPKRRGFFFQGEANEFHDKNYSIS
jgi:hypothetical protein